MARGVGATPDGFSAHLAFGPSAARIARSMVRDLLTRLAITQQLREDAELVAHELVVNAVTHGGAGADTDLGLSVQVSATELVISVHDRGAGGSVEARTLTTEGASGRGLAIVEALSYAWSVDRTDGTRVTARLVR